MKKALVFVLALAMLLGCTAMAEGNLIGYTCMDGTNPFFVTLEGAIREVVEANGDELISLDPQNSNENQISQIEDLISRGIVAIVACSLVLSALFGMNGVWAAFPASEAITACLTLFLLKRKN